MNDPTFADRIAATLLARLRVVLRLSRRTPDTRPTDPFAQAQKAQTGVGLDSSPSEARPLMQHFAEIEAAAIEVYAEHGLPIQPGHYARSARQTKWRFVAESLTAKERWEVALVQRPDAKWRFSTLEDLGNDRGLPERVQVAARTLATLRHLRTRLGPVAGPLDDDVDAALRLATDWRWLVATRAAARAPGLKFSAPKRSKRRPRAAAPSDAEDPSVQAK